MRQLVIRPEIYRYGTAREFAEAFDIGDSDLLITNRYIYEPYLKPLTLSCQVIFQEEYGAGEPTDEMAEAMYQDSKDGVKRVIAVGGGTVLDIAKLFALKNIFPVEELYDGNIEPVKNKELILVPTTCGTGSEVTNISILALNRRGTKKGLASDALYADAAVLIPEFLQTLPYQVFAASSLDALIHAVESSLSPNGNEMTRLFGYEAMRKILCGYQRIREEGREARQMLSGDFLTAAVYAGIAFGNAGCAAVHALSYPLGAKYHVPHGESNYALFLEVLRAYARKETGGELDRMYTFLAEVMGCGKEEVTEELRALLETILPLRPLREYGMTEEDLTDFPLSVLANQQRLLRNNYVFLTEEEIRQIYRNRY